MTPEEDRRADVRVRRLCRIGMWVESRQWSDASADAYRAAALAAGDEEDK